MFVHVTEFAGAAYANHGPAVANPHLFDTVLAQFNLTAQKTPVLQTARLVAEFLLRQANVRLIWNLAPFNETLPAQFQAGGAAAGNEVPLAIAGFTPTSRNGSVVTVATVGRTTANVSGSGLPLTGSIEIYPGGLDSGVFPPVAPLRARVGQLQAAVAANP